MESTTILIARAPKKNHWLRIKTFVPKFSPNYSVNCEIVVTKASLDSWNPIAIIWRYIAVYTMEEVMKETATYRCDKFFDSRGCLYPPNLKDGLQSLLQPLDVAMTK
jgi:hypothetical protein